MTRAPSFSLLVDVNLSCLRERLAETDGVERGYGELDRWLRSHGFTMMPDGHWACEPVSLSWLKAEEIRGQRHVGPWLHDRILRGPWYRGWLPLVAILLNAVLALRAMILFLPFALGHLAGTVRQSMLLAFCSFVLCVRIGNCTLLVRGFGRLRHRSLLFWGTNIPVILIGAIATDRVMNTGLAAEVGFLRAPIALSYLMVSILTTGLTFYLLREQLD